MKYLIHEGATVTRERDGQFATFLGGTVVDLTDEEAKAHASVIQPCSEPESQDTEQQ